jgi:hypothetical protein
MSAEAQIRSAARTREAMLVELELAELRRVPVDRNAGWLYAHPCDET